MAVFTGYNFYIMKNFSLIVVGILFIYCVSSCRKQVDKGFEMTVDLSISNPYLPMSVLVDTIESVRLQLPSPYFWGMVDNVISKDSCYYISDRKQEMAFRIERWILFSWERIVFMSVIWVNERFILTALMENFFIR